MSDVNESVQTAFISTAVMVVFVVAIVNIKSCTVEEIKVKEETKQEAIKAGFVQGDYGRWVKPTSLPHEVEK